VTGRRRRGPGDGLVTISVSVLVTEVQRELLVRKAGNWPVCVYVWGLAGEGIKKSSRSGREDGQRDGT
jgi:hypothetical protein